MQPVYFEDLGRMEYQAAWNYQEQLLKANVDIKTAIRNAEAEPALAAIEPSSFPPDLENAMAGSDMATDDARLTTHHSLLFVEHPPVLTLGKSGKPENILISAEERLQKGIGFFATNRGGDITFHGPGQVVGYPILDLEKFYTDIGRYLRNLEEVGILTLEEYGLSAGRSAGETGIWLDAGVPAKARKICAIGVRCSRWITMHGFALNVNTDLSYFNYIIPCGIQDKQVTSLAAELGRTISLQEVKEKLKKNFERVFDVCLVPAAEK